MNREHGNYDQNKMPADEKDQNMDKNQGGKEDMEREEDGKNKQKGAKGGRY